MKHFLLFIFATSSFAQLPMPLSGIGTIGTIPKFTTGGSTLFDPTQISGLALRWVATNGITASGANVSAWKDSIQSKSFTKTATAHCVTNSTGVVWDGTSGEQLALSSAINLTTPYSIWVVVRPSTLVALGGYEAIVADDPATGVNIIYLNGSSVTQWDVWRTGDNHFGSSGVAANTTYDAAFLYPTSAAITCYTNGVSANRVDGTEQGTTFALKLLGDDTVGDPFNGAIKELCVYTNTSLTAGNVTSLHGYSTNVYGYSP